MAQVILVTSGRGGAGKSTICAFLGEALAQQDKTVLLLEGTRRSLDIFFGVSDRTVFDLSDVTEHRCPLTDALLDAGGTGKLQLLCAPIDEGFSIDGETCEALIQTLDEHYDYLLIEADGANTPQLAAYASVADRAVIVCAADMVSARSARRVSELLTREKVADVRLCVNMLTADFVRRRPIPDLDWLIDNVCAQLICVLPFDRALMSVTSVEQSSCLSNVSKMIFDNFAQRIMGNYIDLLVQ